MSLRSCLKWFALIGVSAVVYGVLRAAGLGPLLTTIIVGAVFIPAGWKIRD